MSAPSITLHVDAGRISPWVFHCVVALEEKRLPYHTESVALPIPAERRAAFQQRAVLGKVPIFQHGDLWLTESMAISEYLAETFPFPAHPRLFPADLGERARARQVMLFLRTDTFALREERPTSMIFERDASSPPPPPLTQAGRASAEELLRVAGRVVAPGTSSMFGDWCIADSDLAMCLMRLVRTGEEVPQHLVDYAEAQWARPSAQAFVQGRASR